MNERTLTGRMTLKKLTEHNQLERRHITWLEKTLVVVSDLKGASLCNTTVQSLAEYTHRNAEITPTAHQPDLYFGLPSRN